MLNAYAHLFLFYVIAAIRAYDSACHKGNFVACQKSNCFCNFYRSAHSLHRMHTLQRRIIIIHGIAGSLQYFSITSTGSNSKLTPFLYRAFLWFMLIMANDIHTLPVCGYKTALSPFAATPSALRTLYNFY